VILTRRGFLKSCLALAAAPAIVKAESLMRIVVPQSAIIVPSQEILSATMTVAGAQIELSPTGTGYIFSCFVKRSGEWVRESYHTDGPVQPVVKMHPDGRIDMGAPHTKVTNFHYGEPMGTIATISGKPDSYVSLGDPNGMYISQASLCISPPHQHTGGLHYPLIKDFEARPMPLGAPRRVRNMLPKGWEK